jgi:hypothetical protein
MMKRTWLFRHLVLFGLIMAILLSMATPAQAAQEFLRLTIDNRTGKAITFYFKGPLYYTFKVAAETTEVFTLKRGEYDYTFSACGVPGKGTLDLKTATRLIMPVCGGNAKGSTKSPNTIDLSPQAKVVKVTFVNKSGTKLWIIMTGPATYVFTLNKGEEKKYTIGRGDYKLTYYACGSSATRNFFADKGKTLALTCP